MKAILISLNWLVSFSLLFCVRTESIKVGLAMGVYFALSSYILNRNLVHVDKLLNRLNNLIK